MEQTVNYGLNMPAEEDYVDISILNQNTVIIDEQLKKVNDGKATKAHASQHKSDGSDPIAAADIGAFPIIDARSADYDMDAILLGGEHFGIYRVNTNTLGTPAKYGKSVYNYGLIISTSNGSGHGKQLAILSGATCLIERRMYQNEIEAWQFVYSTGYKPTPASIGALAMTSGSYTGTGTTSKSITVPSGTKMVVITSDTVAALASGSSTSNKFYYMPTIINTAENSAAIRAYRVGSTDSTSGVQYDSSIVGGVDASSVTFSGTTCTITGRNAYTALNDSNFTYRWTAFY